jgi:hypothetical protein
LTTGFFNVLNCIFKINQSNQINQSIKMTLASPQTMKLAADMFRQAGKDADRAAIEFRKQVRKNKKEKKEKDAAETKNLLAVAKIFSVAEKNAKNKNKAQANKLKIRTNIEKTLNRIITFKSVFGAQLFQNTVEFELDEVYPETRELDFTTAPNTPRSSDSMVQEIVQAFDEVQSHDEIVQAYNELVQASKEQEEQEEQDEQDDLQVFDEQEELFIFDEEELRVFDEQEEIIQAVKELQVVEEKEELQNVEEKEELQVVEEKEKAEEEVVPRSRRSKAPIVVREYTLRSRRSL